MCCVFLYDGALDGSCFVICGIVDQLSSPFFYLYNNRQYILSSMKSPHLPYSSYSASYQGYENQRSVDAAEFHPEFRHPGVAEPREA